MRRYGLRDEQWERIRDLLPGREGHVGATAADHRLFIEAVLYRYRAGIARHDLLERFGDWKNVPRRFSRWSKSGVRATLFSHLAVDADDECAMIDSTIARAHKHSAGAQKSWRRPGDRALYKTRHRIENFFARLKQFRAITTRYDKSASNFLAAIHLAAAVIWLN